MPYTVADWFSEHAEVLIRIPEGRGYTELWVPWPAITQNGAPGAWQERWGQTLDAETLERLGIKPDRHIPGL